MYHTFLHHPSSIIHHPSSIIALTLNKSDDPIAKHVRLRFKALESTPRLALSLNVPLMLENPKTHACHLPAETLYAAIGQKVGATLRMTGCSGTGKITIATALEDRLIKEFGKHVYRLDGDNLRTGLNQDLSFSEAEHAESVRRTGEMVYRL